MTAESVVILIPYCGKPHRPDGVPLAHACRVLPPESMTAALKGNFSQAVAILARDAARGPLPAHEGVWRFRRR
jgi:hypothetical protein